MIIKPGDIVQLDQTVVGLIGWSKSGEDKQLRHEDVIVEVLDCGLTTIVYVRSLASNHEFSCLRMYIKYILLSQ